MQRSQLTVVRNHQKLCRTTRTFISSGPVAIIRIVTCPKDINNRRRSRVIIPEKPCTLSHPFDGTKHAFVIMTEGHELLPLRSIILNCLLSCLVWFYKIKDVKTHRKREKSCFKIYKCCNVSCCQDH